MVNLTNFTSLAVNPFEASGFFTLLIGIAIIVIAFYIVFKVIKNLIANAIIGGIGLILLHFLGPIIGFETPITLTNIGIAIITGLPGLVIIILMKIFGL